MYHMDPSVSNYSKIAMCVKFIAIDRPLNAVGHYILSDKNYLSCLCYMIIKFTKSVFYLTTVRHQMGSYCQSSLNHKSSYCH